MVAVGLVLRAGHLTDWDSWDYAAQALQGHSSDLLLGRWWFLAFLRGAWGIGSAVGLQRADAHLAMQVACLLAMACAVVVTMVWIGQRGGSAAAEGLFAAMIVTGPMVGVYASAVMTEGLTMLCIAGSFLLWELAIGRRRGWPIALAAGAAFGIAVDIREPAVLLAAWPILSCGFDHPPHRWQLLSAALAGTLATLAVGIAGGWAWFPWTDRTYWQNIAQWTRWMTDERTQFAIHLPRQLRLLATYALAASPLSAVGGLLAWSASWRHRRRAFWLGVGTLPYLASVVMNHDLAVNPRFVLPAVWLAGVLAALWADTWLSRPAGQRVAMAAIGGVVAVHVALTAAAWGRLQHFHFDYAASQAQMHRSMRHMPAGALVIAGPGTPVGLHLNRIGACELELIGSGWGWPDSAAALAARIDAAHAAGRPVLANLDATDWHRVQRDSGEYAMLRDVLAPYRLRPRHDLPPFTQVLPPEPAAAGPGPAEHPRNPHSP
jgi:hypothetical protein